MTGSCDGEGRVNCQCRPDDIRKVRESRDLWVCLRSAFGSASRGAGEGGNKMWRGGGTGGTTKG